MASCDEGGLALPFSSMRASAAAAAICASSVGPWRGLGAASAFGFSLGALREAGAARGQLQGTAGPRSPSPPPPNAPRRAPAAPPPSVPGTSPASPPPPVPARTPQPPRPVTGTVPTVSGPAPRS